jgi:hypothetical protein
MARNTLSTTATKLEISPDTERSPKAHSQSMNSKTAAATMMATTKKEDVMRVMLRLRFWDLCFSLSPEKDKERIFVE